MPLILRPRYLLLGVDLLLVSLAWVGAHLLRFNFEIDPAIRSHMLGHLAALVVLRLAAFAPLGLYHRILRYTGLRDLLQIAKAVTLGTLLFSLWAGFRYQFQGVSRSVIVIDWLLCTLLISASRMAVPLVVESRWYLRWRLKSPLPSQPASARAIIYGAGQAGELLVRELLRTPVLGYLPVAFADDDPRKGGLILHDLRVYRGDQLAEAARRERAEVVIVAVPSADSRHRRTILDRCRECGLPVRTLPPVGELLTGKTRIGQIREVSPDDLLGRKVVQLEARKVERLVRGQCVLVTGAGGSIGSELSRQLARFEPARLVLVDRNENALVAVDLEMAEIAPGVPRQAELADITHGADLEALIARTRPDTVFHAAAYKHVPILETNATRAVLNNVGGTLRLAQACRVNGTSRLVLISTDKAVEPSNVMGATKRVGERLMRAMSAQGGPTKFITVRFGNVLGSAGSVVPRFQEQISRGGPVTVTHPEMTRYFMTIPEAVGLVLQAAAIGEGGEIFVLDMGEPVRILDLARELIELSGLKPDDDIPIRFTGLRPGEKIHEQLASADETLAESAHPRLRRIATPPSEDGKFWADLELLLRACDKGGEDQVRGLLQSLAPGAKLSGPRTGQKSS